MGKSFAYLLPAIDYAVKKKKRVVISTHTISLQEQLIDKDIPLLRAVYPDEFTAVLVKGRSNYLCQRRLAQARGRQGMLFDSARQLESLWTIEEWANQTTDGSLTDLPAVPEPGVWDKVCAEHGNCLGKKCEFYQKCFWQSAKRRMTGGNILVVNHALFFSDLALRMAGVNYLPKYDAVVLDEAHTVEDVAGSHFGLKLSESGLRYQLRLLYDVRRGKGLLSTHGTCADDAMRDIMELDDRADEFFEGCVQYHQTAGRSNGRITQANVVENQVSPKLARLVAAPAGDAAAVGEGRRAERSFRRRRQGGDSGADAGCAGGADDGRRRLLAGSGGACRPAQGDAERRAGQRGRRFAKALIRAGPKRRDDQRDAVYGDCSCGAG